MEKSIFKQGDRVYDHYQSSWGAVTGVYQLGDSTYPVDVKFDNGLTETNKQKSSNSKIKKNHIKWKKKQQRLL